MAIAGVKSFGQQSESTVVEKFQQMFSNAFGPEWMAPKFHWMMHYGDHYRKFGMLLNCFVLERRHRTAKRYATELKNISKSANESLIMEVACHQLSTTTSPSAFNYGLGLIDGKNPSNRLLKLITDLLTLHNEDVKVAQYSRFNAFDVCKKGDVVFFLRETPPL